MPRVKSTFWKLLALFCLAHGLWFAFKAFYPDLEMRSSNALVRFSKGSLLRNFYFWTFVVTAAVSGCAALACWTGHTLWVALTRSGAYLTLLLAAAAWLKTWHDRRTQTVVENLVGNSTYRNIEFWLLWIALAAVIALMLSRGRKR